MQNTNWGSFPFFHVEKVSSQPPYVKNDSTTPLYQPLSSEVGATKMALQQFKFKFRISNSIHSLTSLSHPSTSLSLSLSQKNLTKLTSILLSRFNYQFLNPIFIFLFSGRHELSSFNFRSLTKGNLCS